MAKEAEGCSITEGCVGCGSCVKACPRSRLLR
ncbi:MAG: 4Fe-4S binding protein [Olsenella sp.]|nr:4Fe-4S binding protein [Olsenella sp.]